MYFPKHLMQYHKQINTESTMAKGSLTENICVLSSTRAGTCDDD